MQFNIEWPEEGTHEGMHGMDHSTMDHGASMDDASQGAVPRTGESPAEPDAALDTDSDTDSDSGTGAMRSKGHDH